MSDSSRIPGGIDRRVNQAGNFTYHNLSQIALPNIRPGTPAIIECPSRRYLLDFVERHITVATASKVPLTLALMEVTPEDEFPPPFLEAVLNAVAKILRSTLRWSDVILRYRGKTIGILLPSAQCEDSVRIGERLQQSLSKPLFFGKKPITVAPVFAFSDRAQGGNRAENMISVTEARLAQVKAQCLERSEHLLCEP